MEGRGVGVREGVGERLGEMLGGKGLEKEKVGRDGGGD